MLTLEAVVRRCSEKAFTFIKKETLAQVFPCECCKISKKTSFCRVSPVAASVTLIILHQHDAKDVEYYLVPSPFFNA